MNLNDALEAALLEADFPVITDYEFFKLGAQIFAERSWKGEALSRVPAGWDHDRMRNAQRRLRSRQVIAPDADFSMGMWRVVQSSRSGTAEEVASIADPFCYVSHLSAMERYGLTDRSPEALHLTTPSRSIWNLMRDEKVEGDAMHRPDVEAPALVHFSFKSRIRRRLVELHRTSHPATPTTLRGERTHMTSIGRTFADMLDAPELCGGMRHVLEVWGAHATDWVDEIITAVDGLDSKIAKVRAGHILTDRLGINDPRIDGWDAFAQRGGSRKLDPDGPYEPPYSDRWMISINA